MRLSKRPLLLLSLLLTAGNAFAASDQRPVGRFDDRVRHREGGAIGVRGEGVEALAADDSLRAGWEAFRARHGGRWKILIDERTGLPTLVSGRGIAWFAPETAGLDLGRVEQRARAFLADNDELLGDLAPQLHLDLEASGRLGADHWQLIFRQERDGVRVENARLDLHVKRGRLVMFGTSYWGPIETSGVPSLAAAAARTFLDEHLAASTAAFEQVGEPELLLIALDAAPAGGGEPRAWTGPRGKGLDHALIWRFRFRESGAAPLWVGEVDAHDGTVRAFFDGAHYASIRGGVFPVSNDGDCPEGGCEVVGFPMPFADLGESGQPETFTDYFGNLTCVDGAASFETNLAGPFVRIADTCGDVAEFGVCEEGLDLGLKHGENCDTDPSASPGNSAAARSAYYHINRVAEVARFYDPGNAWLQDQVTVNVNQTGSCNAFWTDEINMLRAGNGCGNTGEQHGVLVHEWGHGYDFNDGGGEDVPSEAYADVVAIFATRASCMSRGWYNDGRTCTGYGDTCLTCTGIRDLDWAARQNNTPTTPSNFSIFCPSGPGGPCGREPHCEGYPIGEAIFDLATRDLPAAGLDADTAWQLAERLWYSTRPGGGGNVFDCFRVQLAHSCFAVSWLQRMRVADDDDGDLSNGTPHAAALFAAFDRHEISCGSASDPENQSTSSCPAIGAPVLSVVETPSGTELSWPAVTAAGEVRVYRGELGCNRQQAVIASLDGSATTYLDGTADPDLPRAYRVEALGTTPACHGPVSNCAETPLGARLQPYDQRVVEAGPEINGIPDPGETVLLPVTLFNSGLDASIGTTGRLRLLDAAQGRVLDPDASWANVSPSGTQESDAPHFELVVFESVNCGDTLELEVEASAANSTTRRRGFEITLGERERDFVNDIPVDIPAETTEPAVSTIDVVQDETLAELDVSVWIMHDVPTELTVELTSPEGTTVRLHDQTGGTNLNTLRARYDLERVPDGPGAMTDFDGESIAGTWSLAIQDVGSASVIAASLREWTLHFGVTGAFDCEQQSCADPTPTEAPGNLSLDRVQNGSDLDLVFDWDPVAAVAGYHVLESVSAPFDSTVELSGRTTGVTTLTLPDGAAPAPGLTFYQVRAVNICAQEGP